MYVFGDGDFVMLGGVCVLYGCGLFVYFDGDVVIYVLCDVIFGVLVLGDIG